ncbi:MAG TPA: cupin domain-containing protein [Thermoleophilaceae bacterium]|jgi:uncharacterized cupin superfamily protein
MARTPVPEAPLVDTDLGKKPDGDGWFVVNVGDSAGFGFNDEQYGFVFEAGIGSGFEHFGINLRVLGPGKIGSMYHAESGQEAYLVLEGECTLIVEDEERPLKKWDFVHLPPQTAHVLVGAGDGPSVVLMVGARNAGDDLVFPHSDAAAKYGASVAEDTDDRRVAYSGWPAPEPRRFPWPPPGSSG